MLDAAVAAEALGFAAAPLPFSGTMAMAPLAFTLCATQAQQDEWLPRIAAGEVRFAVAFAGPAGQTGAASASLSGNTLSGRIDGVMDASAATHYLVFGRDGAAAVVAADGLGVTASVRRSIDRTRPLVDVAFDNAPAERLDAANDALAAARTVLDAGRWCGTRRMHRMRCRMRRG